MLDQGQKVELYTMVKKDWELAVKGSPGNQVELLEFLEVESSCGVKIGCLRIVRDKVLLVITDAQGEKEFLASCFIDNDLYTDLEARLIASGVKELIFTKNIKDFSKIKSLLERCQIASSFVQDSYFNTKSLKQDLNNIFSQQELSKTNLSLVDVDAEDSLFALVGCLIKYLGLMNTLSNFGKYSFNLIEFGSYMKLDAAAVKSMNLLPNAQDGVFKNRSLFGVLNHCQTGQGTRLLSQWLRQPLLNVKEIGIFIKFLK
jgi:DNA mismatch repair ATPase MutS